MAAGADKIHVIAKLQSTSVTELAETKMNFTLYKIIPPIAMLT